MLLSASLHFLSSYHNIYFLLVDQMYNCMYFSYLILITQMYFLFRTTIIAKHH